MQTSPTKNSTPNKSVGTPITPAEVGTPMSAGAPIPESPPERKVVIDTSSTETESSPAPIEKTRNPTIIGISSSSPDRNFGTSPFQDKNDSSPAQSRDGGGDDGVGDGGGDDGASPDSKSGSGNEDLLLSSNSDNPTYVASPNHSSQLSSGSSPSSSALRSSPGQ